MKIIGLIVLCWFIFGLVSFLGNVFNEEIKGLLNQIKIKKKLIYLSLVLIIITGVVSYTIKTEYDETYNELIHTIPDNNESYNFIVEYMGFEIVDDNSVGMSYVHRIKVENQEISPYNSIKLKQMLKTLDSTVRFQIQVVEKDSIPDKAYLDEKVDIRKMFYDKKFHWNMYVRENRGRYTGNVAHLEYRFLVYRDVDSSEVWDKMIQELIK